jgi:hypothetical protein
LNSKVLALIWDYFCFILITLFIMAKAGFSFEIKTSFRSSLYAGAKRYNSLFLLESEP